MVLLIGVEAMIQVYDDIGGGGGSIGGGDGDVGRDGGSGGVCVGDNYGGESDDGVVSVSMVAVVGNGSR